MLPAILRRRRLIDQLVRPLSPLLTELFEDSGIGVLALDRAGRIVRTNRRLDEMLAMSMVPPEANGAAAPAKALFVSADRQRVGAALAAAWHGDNPPPLQARLCGGNPAVVVALSIAPLRETDGEISGLLLRLTDVSVQKRLEAELAQFRKLQSVGQLAGGIAHDFNNLLMAIGGAADAVLERENCQHATLDDIRQIRRSADRGAALVRQLLAFGQRQPLLPEVVAVNAAVRVLSDTLGRMLGEQIRLRLELEEPSRSVRVDPAQFDQVLVNLATNARDAMPAGGTLTLRTGHLTLYQPRPVGSETMPPGRYVAIDVQDTGEGIPPAIVPLVFEPFFTTRRDSGGNGLGLSTVYGIVRQSGGFVAVESAVGEGTCVRLWLPRHEEAEDVSTVPHAAAPLSMVAPAAAAARSVLLVEDEESVRRLTERALLRAGWEVAAVNSAEAALERLPRPGDAACPPGVLVSDIMLPGMHGTELVRAVRAVWPDLPAVLVSGYTNSALLGDLAAEGVSFLTKPYRLRDLVACVERAVAECPEL